MAFDKSVMGDWGCLSLLLLALPMTLLPSLAGVGIPGFPVMSPRPYLSTVHDHEKEIGWLSRWWSMISMAKET